MNGKCIQDDLEELVILFEDALDQVDIYAKRGDAIGVTRWQAGADIYRQRLEDAGAVVSEGGIVTWGEKTMSGFDNEGNDWKDLIANEDLSPTERRNAEISVNVGLMQRREIEDLRLRVAQLEHALATSWRLLRDVDQTAPANIVRGGHALANDLVGAIEAIREYLEGKP